MKSRWTLLLNDQAWVKWHKALNCAVYGGAPEQYPCLGTQVPNRHGGPTELVYVYKQEAFVLNACPSSAHFDAEHPSPEVP